MSISSRALKGLICAALACALLPTGASGTEAATPAANARFSAEDAVRAQALLQRAVAHYKEVKDRALADFGPKGEFVDGELYVYVISTAGVMLASGGPSSSVIGSNVADQPDALGKPFVREMLDKARANGSGTVQYLWLNPVDNKVERKIAYFQRIGDRIIAVGYYVARVTQVDQAELDYTWPNPVTGKIESKHTYLRKVDGLLVGVGYYAR